MMKRILFAGSFAASLAAYSAAWAQSSTPLPPAAGRSLGDATDPAYTGGTGSASLNSLLKGLYAKFAAGLILQPGTNAIGTVGVTALPALPAGANAIGTVGVTALPAIPPAPVSITASNPALTPNTDLQVLPANPTRKYLSVIIQPLNCAMNLGFDTPAQVGVGLTYGFGAVVGYGDVWSTGAVPTNAIHVITNQSGCNIAVREGN